MSFAALAAARYSVRTFSHKPLEEETLTRILEAGHRAPTACNLQPQRIVVLNDESSLAKLKTCTKCHFDAPAALLVCYHREECWTRRYDGAKSGTIDATIVTTHMMLAAWELGAGSCWVMHFDPAAMRQAYHIPDEVEPVALLVLGYPAEGAAPLPLHAQMRPMEDTVRFGGWEPNKETS